MLNLMNVLIFGATGQLGQIVTTQALLRGHDVRIFTRDPAHVPHYHEHTQVIIGDVRYLPDVLGAMHGRDVVVVALSQCMYAQNGQTLVTGTTNIIQAMRLFNVPRAIVVLTQHVFNRYHPPAVRHIAEQQVHQLRLFQGSDREWVAVCPPTITNRPPITNYRLGLDTMPVNSESLSKHDLADFVLLNLRDTPYLRNVVGIAE